MAQDQEAKKMREKSPREGQARRVEREKHTDPGSGNGEGRASRWEEGHLQNVLRCKQRSVHVVLQRPRAWESLPCKEGYSRNSRMHPESRTAQGR